MSGTTSSLRARLVGLLDGSAGVAPWTLASGRFHAIVPELESVERTAVERGFTVHIDGRKPMQPVNTLSGYGLFERRVRVRVGYVLTETGDEGTYEASGEQSGASTRAAVEDRSDEDATEIAAVIGSLRNWMTLTPGVSVIDVMPDVGEADALDLLDDRAIRTLFFRLQSRDALPGTSLGPTL